MINNTLSLSIEFSRAYPCRITPNFAFPRRNRGNEQRPSFVTTLTSPSCFLVHLASERYSTVLPFFEARAAKADLEKPVLTEESAVVCSAFNPSKWGMEQTTKSKKTASRSFHVGFNRPTLPRKVALKARVTCSLSSSDFVAVSEEHGCVLPRRML